MNKRIQIRIWIQSFHLRKFLCKKYLQTKILKKTTEINNPILIINK